ncbi:MAG TPA: alpha-E domain-containing protein [Dehalococcoidia bacterium]|nr:alpha-E domain-containing protein [Dehalococcoidia bacterium]
MPLLCRVAEDIFWMSRYVERAIAVGRLIEVTWHLELDAGDLEDDGAQMWAPLIGSAREAGLLSGSMDLAPREIRRYLGFDTSNPGSLISCIRQARSAARGVRESISSEMWESLNTLYLSLIDPTVADQAEDEPHTFYRRVRESAQFVQGLADCTLARDEPWHFIALGQYLERADNVARILNLQSHLLTGTGGLHATGGDLVRLLAVLRSCGAAEAYARYYSLRVEPARVVEFLLLNPIFPQSVNFSLGAAWRALEQIAGPRATATETPNPAVRALGLLRARLEFAAVDEILEEGLAAYLQDVHHRIAVVSDQVTRSYLRDEPQLGRLMPATRAALILAAQQQQQ